ncbi:hypothetical protein [Streptomyces sp. Isolate_219]|uniref:hypothetical protein n=1 Tax=Streptomyces sp. Isolate_219 TaxID=2950110 RepID=UPI0021C5A999|nr:hypothetical protein [Streptomyces sp. Isolate_219]MCR8576467.1 hypothetical protein [Streptomyces sp. Isolate_219]
MADRLRINLGEVFKALRSPEMDAEVERVTRQVEQRVAAQGLQTRVDLKKGPKRMRGAVIAGYEDGATAENTRRALLSSMDGVG